METIKIGNLSVSRFIIGGNPFSGFAHQTPERTAEMLDYYTAENIKAEYEKAEQLGVTTHVGRTDHHVMRVLREYWNEGGKIAWIAQTCPELGAIEKSVSNAIRGRASACFVHGGVMDNYLANNQLHLVPPAIEMIRKAGMSAGVAGHNPEVFAWAEEIDVDFYMCSYYNPTDRSKEAGHSSLNERFRNEDRERMIKVIQDLSKPVFHYKILAAGRNEPEEAFATAVAAMRPIDAVVVGIYAGDDPNMLAKDVQLFKELWTKKISRSATA